MIRDVCTCCSGEKSMRPRSYCLVKSTHMTADCRQVADACISEARLHAPVDVALHVNFGDEVL